MKMCECCGKIYDNSCLVCVTCTRWLTEIKSQKDVKHCLRMSKRIKRRQRERFTGTLGDVTGDVIECAAEIAVELLTDLVD